MSAERFGDRLTRLMKVAGLKNPHIAVATGKDHTTVSKWRSNEQTPPDATIERIVALLQQRGIQTSVRELRDGTTAGGSTPTENHGEVAFESLAAKQRARVSLENLLLELAEEGATEPFLTSARRFLLNAANYEEGFTSGPLDDEGKVRHMQVLAAAVRASLTSQSAPANPKVREIPPEAFAPVRAPAREAAPVRSRKAQGGKRRR